MDDGVICTPEPNRLDVRCKLDLEWRDMGRGLPSIRGALTPVSCVNEHGSLTPNSS